MKTRKYQLPLFLEGKIDQEKYEDWLRKKAAAHVRRDRERGNTTAIGVSYRVEIHRAVVESNGKDFYSGEELHWHLIGTYDNEKAKEGGRRYKKLFAMMPSVDHFDDGLGAANFRICSWQVNDAKSDLSHEEFVALCRRIIAFVERSAS